MTDSTALVVEHERVPAPAEPQRSLSIMNIIESVVARPDVDMDKIERLLAMQREIEADEAERIFNEQFAAMQDKLPVIDATGRGNYGAYGTWDDMQKVIIPVLSEYGFSIQHKPRVEDGIVKVVCVLRHSAGHQDMCELPLPPDNSGGKAGIHAIASSVRYGKRYTTESILCLQVIGDPNSSSTSQQRQASKQQRKSNMKPRQVAQPNQDRLFEDMRASLADCMNAAALNEWDADQRKAGNYERVTQEQFNRLKAEFDHRKEMFS